MDILKNIFLNFNFFLKKEILNLNLNINIIIISFLIKFICLLFIKNNKFYFIIDYLKKFIKKSIYKNSRIIILFFSLNLFNNILFSNLIDLFPNNLIINLINKKINLVPTSNINITTSLSIISIIFITYLSITNIGIFNFIKNFFIFPIKNKYMFLFNFIIEFISFIMKPISLSLRLFGNLFSSEIIFNLINKISFIENYILNILWGSFHYLILPLQSFIFITLVIIYISQTLKH
ncbi:F0F1-type ATP synthase A subunit [Candidatus Carsonella ruddii CS isolate Thao2000]|uniref:F0F1-type ATP synthase A subunit n=1 Tax=Candidatus Carsonella ruddii CS isolate Thao2000 TaxID=1202537 RepID=J7GYJ9_CARRU|nr:F0F1 ATP synthase subunit A [Candidatus Carsonella ruddii]AFP83668.1 F0F1-type ATP synthase A subunit [Candidatus Carsonella ruddii CS isolate Thao2000]